MEFKGTKGKWFRDRVLMKITNESDAEICDYSGYKTTMDEDEANGLLISRAPEMLEMLKYLYNDLKQGALPSEREIQNIEQLIKEATEIN